MTVPSHGAGKRVDTTVMLWGNPENADKTEWMLAHAAEKPIRRVIDGFESEFGIRLNGSQVTRFRATHGMAQRRGYTHDNGRACPVGTERRCKDGYTLVKVADRPSVPCTKDNWVLKHQYVYEREVGQIPEGCIVMFGDGDKENFDPSNLVPCPRSVCGPLNASGLSWEDADGLRACITLIKIRSKANKLESSLARRCWVCGQEFVPDKVVSKFGETVSNAKTCRSCLESGKKAKGEHKHWTTKVCAVCGAEYSAYRKSSRRCPDCISRMPNRSWRQQRSLER